MQFAQNDPYSQPTKGPIDQSTGQPGRLLCILENQQQHQHQLQQRIPNEEKKRAASNIANLKSVKTHKISGKKKRNQAIFWKEKQFWQEHLQPILCSLISKPASWTRLFTVCHSRLKHHISSWQVRHVIPIGGPGLGRSKHLHSSNNNNNNNNFKPKTLSILVLHSKRLMKGKTHEGQLAFYLEVKARRKKTRLGNKRKKEGRNAPFLVPTSVRSKRTGFCKSSPNIWQQALWWA